MVSHYTTSHYSSHNSFQKMKHLRLTHEHGIGPLFDRPTSCHVCYQSFKHNEFAVHLISGQLAHAKCRDKAEMKYPDAPGYKRDGTSKDAAEEMLKEAHTLRHACLECLVFVGPKTADEIADYMGASVLAIRPRISELVARGKIEDSGLRRKNVSGKSAIVWRAK